MNYVIIGNSAAAIGCVEAIRKVDQESKIILISKEKEFTYSRPLISYYLGGEVKADAMGYRSPSFYQDMDCKTYLGAAAESIDPELKIVSLVNGEDISYDKLLVATGGSPIVPPIEGLDQVKERHLFQSMEDALTLEKALSPKKDVLILGGGLIGLKCAEGIGKKAKSITVVDREPQILCSILDEEGAYYVQRAGEAEGIRFILGENAKSFRGNTLVTDSGMELPFDILVIAVGVRPNVELIQNAGGDVGQGIKIDERNETSLKDIYAAGDCVESRDFSDGNAKVMALLPNAYLGGENAGYNMAGQEHVFINTIPVNALKFWGKHLITAGNREGDVYTVKDENNYKKLYYTKNNLKGFMLIGDVERAGIYTSLIRNATPFSEVDFKLIKDKPQLIAFSPKTRRKELGGAQ
ncbi:MAG TPA: FAD-dependent oxidoreductase [Firmicutes bacterium]|nr:FAD-dependent oxidoreductase [Bacillota bacterium]